MNEVIYDNYGFSLSDTFDKDKVNRFEVYYQNVLKKRLQRWKDIMKDGVLPPFNGTMKRFVRKGIPYSLRPKVWFTYSGAEMYYKQHIGAYEKWNCQEISSANQAIIKADVPRTFPENPRFEENENNPDCILQSLHRVLTAFVVKNPQLGYCQGMNFIAGVILLVMLPDEEKAFWVFDTLVTKILHSYYIPGMVRVQVDCQVLEDLLKIKLPHVHSTIVNQCAISTVVICAKWFLCAFVDVLPIQTSLRVLDSVICEGDKILFRAALAIIRMNNLQISQCASLTDLMNLFKNILKSDSVLYCNEFANCMFSMIGSLSQKTVDKLRIEAELKLKSNETLKK